MLVGGVAAGFCGVVEDGEGERRLSLVEAGWLLTVV